MKKVLITGANKGIGFETTKQLLKQGYFVYLGCRNLKKGKEAIEQILSEGLENVELIEIDINSNESVKSARVKLGKKTEAIDILINNAGIAGAYPQNALDADIDNFKNIFETNLYGTIRVSNAFIDLLKKSDEPKLINVSSSIGSLTLHNDPNWVYYDNANSFSAYSVSKAALNMYAITLAYDLKGTPVKVIMVDPGYTKTDFNGNQGTGTVEDAATRVVNAAINNNRPSGSFISEENDAETGEIPW